MAIAGSPELQDMTEFKTDRTVKSINFKLGISNPGIMATLGRPGFEISISKFKLKRPRMTYAPENSLGHEAWAGLHMYDFCYYFVTFLAHDNRSETQGKWHLERATPS